MKTVPANRSRGGENNEWLGIVGRKIGMTRIFTEDGVSVPVTVLDVSNNRVTMVKTVETDGYNAIQVAFGSKKPTRVSKRWPFC